MGSVPMAPHAVNGGLIKVREKPITTYYGADFVQFAETGSRAALIPRLMMPEANWNYAFRGPAPP